MSGYGGKTLPQVVLVGLDRMQSKIGTIFMWFSLPFVVLFLGIFAVSSDTMSEKVPLLYLAGMFGVFTALFFFMSRTRHRVHRSALARALLERPEEVEHVKAELRVPQAGGVRHVAVPMDGSTEFKPLPEESVNVLFIKMAPRMWVSVKLRGKLFARKLVVPQHQGAELLSWLFATVASANVECGWGQAKISDHVG